MLAAARAQAILGCVELGAPAGQHFALQMLYLRIGTTALASIVRPTAPRPHHLHTADEIDSLS